MYPLYEETTARIRVICKEPEHVGPHLHRAAEFVYVIKGTLELGVERELYHMEEGDLGVVFPNTIHHYQAFSETGGRVCHMLADPSACGIPEETLFRYGPKIPVIKKKEVPKDAVHAVRHLMKKQGEMPVVEQAYVQILLGKSVPCLELEEKKKQSDGDLVYQTVVYAASHFRENLSLSQMALELGVSKYVLSRVFSGTFHRNFNQYLNEIRLSYAGELLEYTDRTVMDICMESGFESLRTFNRVFRERYHLTPREYRKSRRERLLETD